MGFLSLWTAEEKETVLTVYRLWTIILQSQDRIRLTLGLHPHLKAFSKPTELAAVTVVFVDDAVLFTAAAVGQVLPHTTLEEAFTALTTDRSVMTAWRQKMKK